MNNIKVRTKMIITGMITAIGMLLLFILMLFSINNLEAISTRTLRDSLREDYDTKIKEQVESASSMIDGIMALVDEGKLTREMALKDSADALRSIRYGEDGYFWADQVDGTNVVLLGSDTEGTMRLHAPDADGFEFVAAIIEAGKNGGGYVDYKFPKEGETVALPKRAYGLLNEKTGWVIGTGNYIDDVDEKINKEIDSIRTRIIVIASSFIIISVIIIMAAFIISGKITRSILRPLKTSFNYIESMAGGDFTTEISAEMLNRGDDFGKLARELEFLKESVGKLIGSVKGMAETLDESMYIVDSQLNHVNSDIDDVSANTEELSAGLTETAASMDQITGYAVEVEKSTHAFRESVEEAAGKILEFHEKISREGEQILKGGSAQIDEAMKAELDESLEKVKIVEEINGLSDSIMGIMNQTNLLALNAAIEAARAGEAGRGFSVVADEIRGLSEQSSESIAKIRKITSEVVSSVEGLAAVAKKLVSHVPDDNSNFSGTADEYIVDSEDYANFVDSTIGMLADQAAKLQDDIDSIMSSVGQISDVSGQAALGVESIANTIMDIRLKTSDLEDAFKNAQEKSTSLEYEISKFAVREENAETKTDKKENTEEKS